MKCDRIVLRNRKLVSKVKAMDKKAVGVKYSSFWTVVVTSSLKKNVDLSFVTHNSALHVYHLILFPHLYFEQILSILYPLKSTGHAGLNMIYFPNALDSQ